MTTTMLKLLDDELDRLEDSYAAGRRYRHLPTGLLGWDLTTGGLPRGGLHLLTGPPGSGLSSLALTIVTNLAVRWKEPALLVTHLQAAQAARRAWAARSLVPIHKIESSRLTEDDWSLLASATGELAHSPIRVQGLTATPGAPSAFIDRLCADIKASPTALVVLDGVDLDSVSLDGTDRPGVAQLHELAVQHDLAILIVGSDPGLRSPELENVADSIVVLQPEDGPDTSTTSATVSIQLNRLGHVGEFPLVFLSECLAWVDVFDTDTPCFGPAI